MVKRFSRSIAVRSDDILNGNSGVIGALIHFGLDMIGATEKDEMRVLALRGGNRHCMITANPMLTLW